MAKNVLHQSKHEEPHTMIDQAKLKLERPFLEIVEMTWEHSGVEMRGFGVRCTLLPQTEKNLWGLVGLEIATREEAEQFIADYGSDKHVAELRRLERRAIAIFNGLKGGEAQP